MPGLTNLALLAAIAACLLTGAASSWAQPGSNGNNPSSRANSKAMTRMMDRYRAKLEVKDDAEWKILQERIEKVLRAHRELEAAVFAANYKNNHSSSKSSGKGTTNTGHGNPSEPSNAEAGADVRALKKLVDTKASPQDIKARLARVREMLRDKQEKLTAAQEELRGVLSARQEAIAVLNGLLR